MSPLNPIFSLIKREEGHTRRFIHLFLIVSLAFIFIIPSVAAERQEPSVRIETLPRWQSATLNIYIFGMPNDGGEYSQDSITLRVAVWGASEDNPLIIRLNNEEAAIISRDGLFTYEWNLRGSHHLLLRDKFKIFDQAAFNIEAPPPPPAMVKLRELEAQMAEQFNTMIMAMVAATALGVPIGIALKKRTRITSQWALMVPALGLALGVRYILNLYMLIPWGIAAALTYQMAKPYAVTRGLLSLDTNGIQLDTMYLDDEGYKVEGVSPRYWRDGFVKRKKLEIKDEYPVLVTGYRFNLTSLCVKRIVEGDDFIRIECDRALAVTLMVKNVVQELTQENAQLKARNVILEAIGSALSSAKIREEVDARLLGMMQGQLGKINPKAILEGVKDLEKKIIQEIPAQ